MAVPKSLVTQLTSFYQAMFNRMVGRAQAQNAVGTGHIGSSPNLTDAGAGLSGNIGGGAIPIGNIAVYPDPNSKAYVKFAFSGNSTIYTIINAIAKKFASIPRYVYEIKDPAAARKYKHLLGQMDHRNLDMVREVKELFIKAYDETVVSNGLSDLLEHPNPMEGQDSFFERVGIYKETCGEAIIWCNRGTDSEDLPLIEGEILEMWVLPPEYMEMVPDPWNVWGSLGWVFNVAGKRIPIDNENIIHWKSPNINFDGVTREHMRGMSALRPGNKKLTEDESATDASVAMNQNDGAKGIAYDTTPGKISPEKETAMRSAVDRKVNNRDAKGSVAWLQGNLGYLDLAQTSVEMDLETRKDNIFDRLCNMFQTPPDLFKTGQTYQNMLQARKDWITNKILPMCCSFRDELNRVLLPAFNLNKKSYTTDVDVTSIPELQDDMTALVNSLVAAWWMTPNERRKEMNIEESDGEGMDDVWIMNNLVKMEDAAQPADDLSSFDPQTGLPIPAAPGTANPGQDDPTDKDTDPAPGPGGKKSNPKTGKNASGGKNKGNS